MTVRPMRPDERAAVLTMMRTLWGGADDADVDDATVFVWPRAGGPGGFASLALRPWAEGCSSSPVPYLEGWFVAPDLRGTGVGRALVAAAEAWARAEGFTEIGSDARLGNPEGLRAHRRLGFEPTERLQCFRKSLLPGSDAGAEVRVETWSGAREDLRALFELAEDSPTQLESYLHAGRVLVALSGPEVIGHLQLVDTGRAGQVEITNMAVQEAWQGRGVGGRLVRAAADLVAAEGGTTLLVATAAAGVETLRFYQRQGFRLRSVERDAFTPATGYPPGIRIDGVGLRDRVWLDQPVGRATHPGGAGDARWVASRVARPVRDLARSAAFYRDLLGLEQHGGFADHDGYDGAFFALPGGGELELTAGPVAPVPATEDDLLVLYLATADEVGRMAAVLDAAGVPGVPSANPYWDRWGRTFLDPDGHRVVLATGSP